MRAIVLLAVPMVLVCGERAVAQCSSGMCRPMRGPNGLENAKPGEPGRGVALVLRQQAHRRAGNSAVARSAEQRGRDPQLVVERKVLDATVAEMMRASDAVLRQGLKHQHPVYRLASAQAVWKRKKTEMFLDLIDLTNDDYNGVRQAARQSLIQISKGYGREEDFGPLPGCDVGQRWEASQLWREWWDEARRKGR